MTNSIVSSMVLSLLFLAACGGEQTPSAPAEVIAEVEIVRPVVQRDLVASDGMLLSPRDIVGGDESLLILDSSSDEVWELSLKPTHELRRVSRPRRFGQARVFAFTAHPAGLSLIGVDGSLRVMNRENPDELARTLRVFAPRHRPIALGVLPSGGWVAVHSVLVIQNSMVDSVIVSTIDTAGRVARRFGFERSGPSRPGMFLVDRVSARAIGDRVFLAGADPARVITVTAESLWVDSLLDAPVREINEKEREGIRQMLNAGTTAASLRQSKPPTQRYPVLDALPFEGGYLVVAQGGEEATFVDLYCERTFRRTVLSRASLTEIYTTKYGLAAVDEPTPAKPDAPARLSLYRPQDFLAECAQ